MSNVVVVTPPEPVLELDVVKKHLNVDHDDDDALIAAYLAACTANLDGPVGWLGRALGEQTLALSLRGWGDGWSPQLGLRLPCPPIQSIGGVTYIDTAGAEQTLDPALYALDPDGTWRATYGATWPCARQEWGPSWTVTYVAGYADGALPPAVTVALLLMVGDLYANRDAAVIDTRAARVENPAVINLLAPLRVWG